MAVVARMAIDKAQVLIQSPERDAKSVC
jgi:hypothetical protein